MDTDSKQKMAAQAMAARRTWREGLARELRQRGWHLSTSPAWRHRIVDLLDDRRPWWDWGHRLMTLVGENQTGSWDEPELATVWYRMDQVPQVGHRARRRWHRPVVVRRYDEVPKGLDEDERYAWRAIAMDQDGELVLGRQYWGDTYPNRLSRDELGLLTRQLIRWQLKDWFGFRTWLWRVGLTHAVYARKPGSCAQPPGRNSGGYSHWLCQERRGHDGPHRYLSMTWCDGERVVHGDPVVR